MNILKVRHQIKSEGISFYDLPLRVAYYARVSTEFMEQLNSLENQKKFFTDYIGNMPNWEFAGGYIDEGLSGITTKKRERFNEMIEDARVIATTPAPSAVCADELPLIGLEEHNE